MTLHFSQFAGLASAKVVTNPNTDGVGPVQVAKGLLASDTIVLTGSTQPSAAFNVNTRVLRVAATVAAWISIGPAPVATVATNRIYMPAGSVDYFGVNAGDKIDGITA